LSFTAKGATEEKCTTSIRREARGKGKEARNISPLASSLSPKPPFEDGTPLADINQQQAAEKPIRHSKVWGMSGFSGLSSLSGFLVERN
jgi:hypothetical protein